MSIEISYASDFYTWIQRMFQLNKNAPAAKYLQVKRGEVYWCDFGLNIGSEISKATPRPAVIVQNNPGNLHSPNTIVVPVTHSTVTAYYCVPIKAQQKPDGSILLDGKANVSAVTCVSKARLVARITQLPNNEMRQIDAALARILSIAPTPPQNSDNQDGEQTAQQQEGVENT